MTTTDSHFSSDLLWEVTKSYNSFQVKRRSGGGSLFSRDPLNLTNKQTRKHAGFINDKAIGVAPGKSGGITVTRKKGSKSAGAHQPGSHLHVSSHGKGGPRSSYSKVAGSAAKGGEGQGYRADLRKEAVARASAIHKTYGSKKDARPTKLRGGKAKRAAEE